MKHSAKEGRTGWAEKHEGGKANAGQGYPIIDTHTLLILTTVLPRVLKTEKLGLRLTIELPEHYAIE